MTRTLCQLLHIYQQHFYSILALAAGDPHIVTLDGLEYSFNGAGDYYLVYDEATSLQIQVRAVQALDKEGKIPLWLVSYEICF